MNHHLFAGYAQRAITPALHPPVYLAGFDPNRRAESVHDDLWVRALALAWGETRLVLACVDLIGLNRVHCQEISRRVNQKWGRTDVIVAATHIHHGPDSIGLWGPSPTRSGVDLNYLNHLKKVAADCCHEALHALSPVSLRAATVSVPEVVQNFRDPAIVDSELSCLQLVDQSRRPFATLLIFPCHPEVLWRENTAITSDYAHSLRRRVEEATGAPALFAVGALGGMLSPAMEEHTFAAAEAMGNRLGEAALSALAAQPHSAVRHVALTRREFTTPMTNPLFQMAVDNGLLPNLFEADGQVRAEAGLLEIESDEERLLLATVPGELFPALGLKLKAEMRAAGATHAAVVGLANDELGYILPDEEFVYPDDPFQPGAHYEETMSVGPQAGSATTAAIRALLAERGGG